MILIGNRCFGLNIKSKTWNQAKDIEDMIKTV